MTINVQIDTVIASIANISVSGVTVCGLNSIPENALSIVPVLFPSPDGLVTDMTFTPVSYGSDTQRMMDLEYTLNYRFLHSVVGSGGGLLSTYGDFITKLTLILEAILGNSTPGGSVDMSLQGVSDIGPMVDPGESATYHGVDIQLRVKEFAQ